MNLNKNFLTEVIKYLINRGVTLTDVLDTFNEHFNTSDNAIKYEHEKHDEVRKSITDIDLLLCGRSVEESSTPCQKVKKKTENTEKPVNKSWIDYPKNLKNHGNGVSPARKALFDVINGKTVIEHLKENGITYSNFDNRIRKNWTMEKACTTPMTRVIKPYTKSKKPEETLETKTETLETESNTEKATESVTNATALNGNNVTAVIVDTPNPDAIRKDKNDIVEKALKKFITHSEESKKDKKPKEPKKDYTVTDVCFKLNITTHELKEKIENGEFPQPDCDKKWSVKLLKKEGII